MIRVARALLVVGGVFVLVALVARVGPAVISDMLRRVGWAFMAVSALYGAHDVLRALALWRSLPSPVLSFAEVLRVRLSGEVVETLTFSGPFLAEPAQGWLLTRRGLSVAEAYAAVAIEYLLYAVVSAWMTIAALTMLFARGALPDGLRTAVVVIIVAMVAFTVAFFAAVISGVGFIVPMIRCVAVIAGRARADAAALRFEPVERVLVDFMHTRPARLAEVLMIEAAGHALLALEIWAVVRALGFHLTRVDPFIVEGGVKFIAVAFFFIPGQLGASEGLYAMLFGSIGLPAAVGLTMALVRRIRALMVAGAALGWLALTRGDRVEDPSTQTDAD